MIGVVVALVVRVEDIVVRIDVVGFDGIVVLIVGVVVSEVVVGVDVYVAVEVTEGRVEHKTNSSRHWCVASTNCEQAFSDTTPFDNNLTHGPSP
jgi:hypothetical protein